MKLISNLKATGMIVMYVNDERSGYNHNISSENVYFEYAPIVQSVPGAFIPLSNAVAADLGKCLTAKSSVEVGGFVPKNLLYCGLGSGDPSLIWYTEPGPKRSLYDLDMFPSELTFNVPWLVWYYHRGHLYLFAAKQKPNMHTRLFKAPFGNISGLGSVCLGGGTSVLNRAYSGFEELMTLTELAFFGTKFTEQNEKKTVKGNLISLQKQLAETGVPFPNSALIGYKKTIKNLIDGQEDFDNDEDYDEDEDD